MSVKVSSLHYYPVKSCAGTTIQTAEIGLRGIVHDREWMLVNESDQCLTQRELQTMCLINPVVTEIGGELVLSLQAPNMQPISIPATSSQGQHHVTVWEDTCKADDQGDEAAYWLSKFLGTPVRLVRMSTDNIRQVDQKYAHRSTDQVGFADEYPLLLISRASLDELNSRLPSQMEMNRFRPNIVVTGCGAFDEDQWHTITIGKVAFDVVKPCARCVITTVEQTTGNTGPEPLKTLASFRHINNRVLFGQYLVHQSPGRINLGDELQVQVKTRA